MNDSTDMDDVNDVGELDEPGYGDEAGELDEPGYGDEAGELDEPGYGDEAGELDDLDDPGDTDETEDAPGRVAVGTVGFDGPRGRTFAKLDCIELQDTLGGVPGEAQLKRLRREAGDGFDFVIRASGAITHPQDPRLSSVVLPYLPGGERPATAFDSGEAGRAAWRWTSEVARLVGASAVLLQTPASFRPTPQRRDRLARWVSEIAGASPFYLIWDSLGLWEPEAQLALSTKLGLVPTLDPLVDPVPETDALYLRVLGRRRSPHGLSADELDRIEEAVGDRGWCRVMLHTPTAFRDARAVRSRLRGRARSPL